MVNADAPKDRSSEEDPKLRDPEQEGQTRQQPHTTAGAQYICVQNMGECQIYAVLAVCVICFNGTRFKDAMNDIGDGQITDVRTSSTVDNLSKNGQGINGEEMKKKGIDFKDIGLFLLGTNSSTTTSA